jgi:hypothetical protein
MIDIWILELMILLVQTYVLRYLLDSFKKVAQNYYADGNTKTTYQV